MWSSGGRGLGNRAGAAEEEGGVRSGVISEAQQTQQLGGGAFSAGMDFTMRV